MHSYHWGSVALAAGILLAATVARTAPEADWNVVERGPNHSRWQRWVEFQHPTTGQLIRRPQSIIELAGGLNYQDQRGGWFPAEDRFEFGGSGARVSRTRVPVELAANLNQVGAVQVGLTEQGGFQATPLALAYHEVSTGRRVWLGIVQDAAGVLHPPRTVIYEDAFTGVVADIYYVVQRDRVEQFVVVRAAPAAPEKYGLRATDCLLECWTEFYGVHDGTAQQKWLPDGESDESLRLGGIELVVGKAFLLGHGENDHRAIPVGKRLETDDGRIFLIESVRYAAAAPALSELPAAPQQAGFGPQRPPRPADLLRGAHRPAPRQAALAVPGKVGAAMQLAAHGPQGQGWVLDWTALTAAATNQVFAAGQTYAISGSITLSGTTHFEDNSVLKYTNQASLTLRGPVVCASSPYRPSILTSWHDDTAGEVLPGSVGIVTQRMAEVTLKLDAYSAGASMTLENLRIRHAGVGIQFFGGSDHLVRHVQLVDCATPFQFYYANASLRNALVMSAGNVFECAGTSTARVEHVTIQDAVNLASKAMGGSVVLRLTNALLVQVTNLGSGYITNESVNVVTGGPEVLRRFGAAGAYLAADSGLQDGGTTGINATLAAELRTMTVTPPQLLSGPLRGDRWLAPVILRDADPPAVGYHYPAVDYVLSGVEFTNGTLHIAPGTVLAAWGNDSSGVGLTCGGAARVIAAGRPEQPVRVISLAAVEEGGRTSLCHAVYAQVAVDWFGVGAAGLHEWRHAEWSTGPRDTYALGLSGDVVTSGRVILRDSQFHGGLVYADSVPLALTNNLFNATAVWIRDASGAFVGNPPPSLDLELNTFHRGSLEILAQSYDPWGRLRRNLLGSDSLTVLPDQHGANGYLVGMSPLTPLQSTDQTNVVLNWQAGPLGRFYHATNTVLINAGGTSATNLGMYHFTITTNLIKEGVSVVDIGHHYAATDAQGVPVDSDLDGIPDWLEDRDGDGVVEAGESSWTDYTSPSGLGGILGLTVFTPLK